MSITHLYVYIVQIIYYINDIFEGAKALNLPKYTPMNILKSLTYYF